MNVHRVSMHSLRMAYGKSARDDKMIDAYLQHRYEASNKKMPSEYLNAPERS